MIITTTHNIENRPVREYLGLVTGEVIAGANIFKDIFASFRDVVGGRAAAYENTLRETRLEALAALEAEARKRGADAVIAVDIDYEIIGKSGSMMLVSATGTAVRL